MRYLSFCHDLFGHVKKLLDKNSKVIFEIYDVINRGQLITIHISPNISRSKGYQIMELGQLIEYNMRNVLLEKLYRKCGRKTTILAKIFGTK